MKTVFLTLVTVLAFNLGNAQCEVKSTTDISGETHDRIYTGAIRAGIAFHRFTLKNGDVNTYIDLATQSTYLTSAPDDVTLYFEDGSSLHLTEEVDYDSGSGSYWNYSSFFRLTPSLKAKLLKTPLIGFELYIFEQLVDGEKVIAALNCLN